MSTMWDNTVAKNEITAPLHFVIIPMQNQSMMANRTPNFYLGDSLRETGQTSSQAIMAE